MAGPDRPPAGGAGGSQASPGSPPRTEATADPDAVAAAVLACPDVVRLSRSTPGAHIDGVCADVETATYLPGRRVGGVRVRPGHILVQVVCGYGPPVAQMAGRIRAAVRAVVPGRPRIDVIIDDLEMPPAAGGARAARPPAKAGA